MSIQFGRWNFEGQPVDGGFVRRAAAITAKYGSNAETLCLRGPLAMYFQPFHTTTESGHEHQPLTNPSGAVLTWDGRLDNRKELLRLLHIPAGSRQTDSDLVLAAYEHWDTACFARLIGDWALALWDPIKKAVLLAKDFVGTRHLFYTLEATRITWSTVLDPLVVLGERSLHISEEFVAAYLSTLPATHLTPYVGIHAVPAATCVHVKHAGSSICEYWGFDPSYRIRYRTDAEYEEHFRVVFAEAVRRRLRASSPVLAELSGGMDSSAVVCMADHLLGEGNGETPRLDTISYYDNDEPNWNERPYFSLVEKKRGRDGYHINIGGTEGALVAPAKGRFFPLPGFDSKSLSRSGELSRCLGTSQSRVLLSGIGGDEFLGGVPTPIPELQDLFTRFRWIDLLRRLSRFSLQQRRPWLHLWFDTFEEFLPQTFRRLYKRPRIASWLSRAFVSRNSQVFSADSQRTELLGARPSFQSNLNAVNHLRRLLGFSHLSEISHFRVSYPYLDRDLLTFLFAVPRQQHVRPGQRRSLMRRALVGLVPPEILSRKRKAFLARNPVAQLHAAQPCLGQLHDLPLLAAYGWVDPATFAANLESARHRDSEHVIAAISTLKLEIWLQALEQCNLLSHVAAGRNSIANDRCTQKNTALATEPMEGRFNPQGLDDR